MEVTLTGKTHLVGALLASTVLSFGLDPVGTMAFVATAAIGCKVPDLDRVINSGPSHRSLPHSLGIAGGAVVALALFAAALPDANTFLITSGFAVGYLSHLLLDALTPSKIPLLLPGGPRFGIGIIPTGSLREGACFFLLTLLLVGVLVLRGLQILGLR